MFRSTFLKPSVLRLRVSHHTTTLDRRSLPSASFSTSLPKRDVHLQSLPGPLLRCPKCQTVLPTPLPACTNCFYIQRINNKVPYHELFQLPSEPNPFVVDTFQLKRRYLEAQKLCHPDGWASRGEDSQKTAEGLSNYIGIAFSALKDPLSRAEYILKSHGIEIAEEDQLEDFELISEIMDVREQLEDATSTKVGKIADVNYEHITKTCKDIEKHVGEQDWEQAKKATIRLKYLDGIKRAASEWRP